jgi:hypothetical protein
MKSSRDNLHLSFALELWKKKASGLVIYSSGEWSLLIYNPVDYVCDGYILARGKTVAKETYKRRDEWTERVLIKKSKRFVIPKINLSSTFTVLRSLKRLKIVVGIWSPNREVIWIGKIKKISEDYVSLKLLDTRATWTGEKSIRLTKLSVIEFGSDYITTLEMMAK